MVHLSFHHPLSITILTSLNSLQPRGHFRGVTGNKTALGFATSLLHYY